MPLDNYISRSTAHFLTCKEPDYQQSLWNMISSVSWSFIKFGPHPIDSSDYFGLIMQVMGDKNLEDGDIEPAPKLIQVLFQNCRGQVDHWVEPYLRITVERLRRTEKPYLKCLLMEVVGISCFSQVHHFPGYLDICIYLLVFIYLLPVVNHMIMIMVMTFDRSLMLCTIMHH